MRVRCRSDELDRRWTDEAGDVRVRLQRCAQREAKGRAVAMRWRGASGARRAKAGRCEAMAVRDGEWRWQAVVRAGGERRLAAGGEWGRRSAPVGSAL